MIRVEKLVGPAILKFTQDLARLRIEIFRDFPYLYEGDLNYEEKYLARYMRSSHAAIIAARDSLENDRIVGAATVLPLSQEDPSIQKPFLEFGHAIETIYYFGESLLDPRFRGQGLGHRFFDEREKHALQDSNCKMTAFCAVDRPVDHPKRPQNYKPLHDFWTKRGYQVQPQLKTEFSWRDLGDSHETMKPMTFWTKEWK